MQAPSVSSVAPTVTVNSDHPDIQAYASRLTEGVSDKREQAVALYYAVRDDVRYDPYSFNVDPKSFAADRTLKAGIGWCVPKAILLAACCRAVGIPARLGFADVKNHLSTERLRKAMKTDVFHWHGYTSIFLDGKWVKATPAFNIQLCDKFGLKPLEFDGREDSIYHEFDRAGNRHMEYIRERGEYDDVPFDEMMTLFRDVYGGMLDSTDFDSASFDADVDAENP